jgi:anti-sigma B factor antagonist
VAVEIGGELDLASADQLMAILKREFTVGRSVFLDLSAVEFIDSTGLAAIVNAQHHATESGVSLEVCSELQSQPRRLMELTGVLPMLPFVERRITASP